MVEKKMIKPEKQFVVYYIGIILGILIGVAFWQTETLGVGGFALGTILFGFLIGNYLIFHKNLENSFAVIYGITALITAFWGTFVTFNIIYAIIYGILIALVVLGIYLSIERKTS